jgi:hypothetical protein
MAKFSKIAFEAAELQKYKRDVEKKVKPSKEWLAAERQEQKMVSQLRSIQRREKEVRALAYGDAQSPTFFPRRSIDRRAIPSKKIGGGLSDYIDFVPLDGEWCQMYIDGAWRTILDHPLAELTVKTIKNKFYDPIVVNGKTVARWSFPPDTPTCISDAVCYGCDAFFETERQCSFYSKRYWAEKRMRELCSETGAIVEKMRQIALQKPAFPYHIRHPKVKLEDVECKCDCHWPSMNPIHDLGRPPCSKCQPLPCGSDIEPERARHRVGEFQPRVRERGEDVVDAKGKAQFSIDINILPASVVNSLLKQAEPMIRDLSEKFESMKSTGQWMRIVLEAFFALCHMYQAGWTVGSVLTSVTHFLMSLPVVAAVQTKLIEWGLEFINKFTDPDPEEEDLVAFHRARLPQTRPPRKGKSQFDVNSGEDWLKAVTGVAAVLTTGFVVVGLGVMPGGATTNNLFNRLSRLNACAASLAALQDWLTKLIDELLDYVRVSWFGYESRQLDAWKDFDKWCDGVAALRNCDFENAARLEPSVKIEVERLLEDQEKWQKQMATMRFPDAQRSRFTILSLFLEKARVACAVSGSGEHKSRQPATIFHFVGGTGIGKSEMLNMLNAYLLAKHGYTDVRDLATKVYYRDATQQRWDGFTNRVQGVVWDDFGMVKDTLANPSKEPPELVRADNGAPWQLEMANLAEKANTYFQAKWVLLTSNQSTFKWDSLTNGEAVARRITKKFRQTVAPEFQKRRVIEGKECIVLDVEKVTLTAADDESVYERVWRFQEVDPTNLSTDAHDVNIGESLSFDEMAQLVYRTLNARASAARQKLTHVENYFRKCVERPDNEGEAEMEQQRSVRPKERLGRSAMMEEVAPAELETTLDEVKLKQATRSVSWYASTPEEFAEKSKAAGKYLFGRPSSGPTGSGADSYTSLSGVHGKSKEKPMREDALTHFASLRSYPETWSEWATGRVHLNLAKVVKRAPVNGEPVPVTTVPPDDYDAVQLLGMTCVSVPKKQAALFIETFSRAYLTLSATKVELGAERACEFVRMGMPFDSTSLDVFNAQMWSGYGSLYDVSVCCEHGEPEDKMTCAYDVLTRAESKLIDMCDWMKMTAASFAAEIKFVALRTLLIVILTMAIGSLFTWLVKRFGAVHKSKKQLKEEKRLANAESAQDSTRGARRGATESAQETTRGGRRGDTESAQDNTQGARRGNVESAEDRTLGPRRGPAEASFDQNAKELETKIAKSLYALWWKRDGVENKLGMMMFISGRVAITNRHIANVLTHGSVRLVNQDFRKPIDIDVSELVIKTLDDDSVHGYKDVAMVEFPRSMRPHADLRKHFMTRDDFRLHGELCQVGLFTVTSEGFFEGRYSQLCKADDRVFQLACSGQPERQVRDWYAYDVPTRVGDCGGLLCSFDSSFERKFIGIHMAGTKCKPWSAIAVAIHQGVLEELVKKFTFRFPESLDCNNIVAPEPCGDSQHRPFDGEYTLLGRTPPVHENVRTEIVPSPVAKDIERAFGPALTKPAMLRPNSEHDPLEKARQKAFTPGVHLEESVLDDCVNNYKQLLFKNTLKTDQRVLSREEAIAGVEGDPFYTGIKRNTSCGYGWPKIGVGKSAYLGDDGEYVCDHPEVVQRTDEMMRRLKAGERSGTIWTDTLKDERRNIAKVDAGKTRLFSAGELAFLIVFRRYFAGFAAHMTRNRIDVESCVGVNVFGIDWTRIAEVLRRHGPHVVAGDFTNYDGSLAAQLLWRCLDVINEWYDGTEEESYIRRRLWFDIVHSVHVTQGVLYMWDHSQPSGCPITAILNSLYHSLAARYVYVLCARKYCPDMVALSNFSANVSHINYGDDDVYNISDKIIEWYNQITMAEMFQRLGMTYTDELKTGQMVRSRTFEEIQFLKRKFRWDAGQGRFRAPLTLDTITEMARWVKGKRNSWQLTAETLEAALMESAEHDRETYMRVADGLKDAMRRTQVRVPVVFDTFHERQLKALSNCYI